VIGVGGVSGYRDALQYLLAGCSLVGVGSGLYFEGPRLFEGMNAGIEEWMEAREYGKPEDFIGKVRRLICDGRTLGERESFPFSIPPDAPYIPLADPEICSGCGLCSGACLYRALRVDEDIGRPVADPGLCWSCGFCVGICPEGALSLRDRQDLDRVVWENRGTALPFKGCWDKE
jgi:ferredoxin